MKGEATTKKVLRMLMAWNEEKEGRWLEEQERSGWHLKRVGCLRYTFERAAPAEVAYRLDLIPPRRSDRSEYFGLFRDAGWEHVGSRGLFQYFRKDLVDGQSAEIHTDPRSRIAMYQRLVGLTGAMLGMLIAITASNLNLKPSLFERYPVFLGLYVLMMVLFAYGTLRLLLIIRRIRKGPGTQI